MKCKLCDDYGMVRTPDWENGGWEECPICHPPPPKGEGRLPRAWKWFLARFRLSESAVCEMSKGRGLADDFHDYPDDELGTPAHFVTLKCKRCGKSFTM